MFLYFISCIFVNKRVGFKILFIDDEEDILKLLAYNFGKDGYVVYTAKTGKEGFDKALKFVPDIILLDIMLPDMDGIEVCELLRKQDVLKDSLILFLSARAEDYSQVAGYRAGGDDYIIKPVRIKVLKHKIKALLDRNTKHFNTTLGKSLILNKERFSILKDGMESFIPKKEFELLSFLMNSPQKVCRREEILQMVWGDTLVSDRTIDVHVRKLREKFGAGIIRTVKGVGYRFTG